MEQEKQKVSGKRGISHNSKDEAEEENSRRKATILSLWVSIQLREEDVRMERNAARCKQHVAHTYPNSGTNTAQKSSKTRLK